MAKTMPSVGLKAHADPEGGVGDNVGIEDAVVAVGVGVFVGVAWDGPKGTESSW
ncbi:MAG: hypothetical protein ACP5UQ_15860 [Anaerolineae bacterium]